VPRFDLILMDNFTSIIIFTNNFLTKTHFDYLNFRTKLRIIKWDRNIQINKEVTMARLNINFREDITYITITFKNIKC